MFWPAYPWSTDPTDRKDRTVFGLAGLGNMWQVICCHVWMWCFGVASLAIATEPPITALAFDPDGRSILAASQSGLVEHAWPLLEPQRRMGSSLVSIHSLAFSPDGSKLAVGGGTPAEQGVVEIRSWPEGEVLCTVDGHSDTVQSVTWRNNDVFATASLDHEVVLWRVGETHPIRRFRGHSKGVTTIEFMADGALIVSGALDQNIRIWNVETGELVRTLNNHTRAIHELRKRPQVNDSQTRRLPMLVSVSDDRTVRLWQPTIGRLVRFCRLDVVPLSVAWQTNGVWLTVACDDGSVRNIHPDTMEVLSVTSAAQAWLYAIRAHPTDGSLAVGSREGQLRRLSNEQIIPLPISTP